MNTSKKQEQNRTNYLKNREKLLERAKARREAEKGGSNVIPIRAQDTDESFKPKPPIKAEVKSKTIHPEVILLIPLVALMTYYLITESARFYQFAELDPVGAYLKAFIAEGIVLAFSAMKAKTASLRWLYRTVLVLTGVYSLWSISASTAANALNQSLASKENQKMFLELEAELKQRIDSRNHYLNLNRITVARSYEQSIDRLSEKLESVRHSIRAVGHSAAAINTAIALIFFRALVLIANSLCVSRLKKLIRFSQLAGFS